MAGWALGHYRCCGLCGVRAAHTRLFWVVAGSRYLAVELHFCGRSIFGLRDFWKFVGVLTI